ncbi:hypothetical protein E2562_038503 [Oryza meyeriana var. granulata]|uniref:Uncharacterized protein n=1 Tax=Oryza meyeriana var. granulata TaxID=110450 RepID=A0A6G1EU98_9ORYZ|nr:hypothetical protein E2562_038503 [Oryza meyeriana var. granulata]
MRFTGYGSSIHKAINNAAYIAMAHTVHLHVELAAQYPYHPARPLGEEVHLYLSAEHEPNPVLRNLAEYVCSSDRYHHVIGVELQQAHGHIAHLESLIEPYVRMGHITRIELYSVEDVTAPAPAAAAAHRPAAAPTHVTASTPTPVAQEPMHEQLKKESPLNLNTKISPNSNVVHVVAQISPWLVHLPMDSH